MKIIYTGVSPVPSLAANGVHLMKMAQAMASLGHQVIFISKKSTLIVENLFDFYGVKPIFTFWSFYCLSTKLHAFRVAATARWLKVDIVYTRCLLTAMYAANLGNKVIYECHNSFDKKLLATRKIFNKLIKNKNLKKIIVISYALANHLSQEHNIPPNKLIVAPDGADPISSTLLPSPYQRYADKPIVGYIGHLYKGRGIDVIITLAKNLSHVDFHIVGGTLEDISYWKNQTEGMTNIFFHGHVNPSITNTYVINCDILLAPYQLKVEVAGGGGDTSRWMSPLKIFEYMAAGKPIVCSDLPVLREILNKNKTALLCPPDDIAAWQNAIEQLCVDSNLARQLGKQAKEKFLTHYTWKKRAEFILNSVFPID